MTTSAAFMAAATIAGGSLPCAFLGCIVTTMGSAPASATASISAMAIDMVLVSAQIHTRSPGRTRAAVRTRLRTLSSRDTAVVMGRSFRPYRLLARPARFLAAAGRRTPGKQPPIASALLPQEGSTMRTISAVLALALLLGVLGMASTTVTNAQERPFVVALGAEPRSLLPMLIVDWTTNVQQMNIYDRLYYWDGDPPRIKPSLAAEPVQTPDELTWIIKLRAGVKFSNGDSLTSDDVKSTIESLLDPKNQSAYRPPFP